ncbi:hypothetical protein PAERUG_E9_London_17_VIM_2_04_13_06381 [Pseudomonas aeruginosa]|nr:hypothetical protein PAERUG_E9_London_17_VIM_2_04_13_06381 [Pseudomonas aeruginosa]
MDAVDQAFQVGGADHPQRGAEAAGGQGAGIAVGEDVLRAALLLADQLHAQLGHGQVGLAVAVMDGDRLGLQHRQRPIPLLHTLQALAHAVQRPEQVDRGGPRVGQQAEVFLQRRAPIAAPGQARAGAEDDAVGRADADGRRTAHDHVANGLGHLGRRPVVEPDLLLGQQALIQQPQRTVPPLDRLDPLGRQQSLSHAHTSR